MAEKKVVIFLVEGWSELNAFESPFDIIFSKHKYHDKKCIVKFGYINNNNLRSGFGGDITSDRNVNSKNIKQKILEWMIKPLLTSFYAEDIEEVVHIVDMDGAFIPNENIVPKTSDTEKNVIYGDGKIFARCPEKIIKRNEQKQKNLNCLLSTSTIVIKHIIHSNKFKGKGNDKGELHRAVVPYSVYYFSSNLDHYIHYDANLRDSEKTRKATSFCHKCLGNMDLFYKIFVNDVDSVSNISYINSWKYIKDGINSIKRHTNLGIFIKNIK